MGVQIDEQTAHMRLHNTNTNTHQEFLDPEQEEIHWEENTKKGICFQLEKTAAVALYIDV